MEAAAILRGGKQPPHPHMRCAHDAATDNFLTGPTEEELWQDLLVVTGGQTR